MLGVFPRQVRGLVKVTTLTAHRYGSVEVELGLSRRLDELFELVDVFQFRVTIQEENSVVRGGFMMLMQFFEIINEIMNPLGVQELQYY